MRRCVLFLALLFLTATLADRVPAQGTRHQPLKPVEGDLQKFIDEVMELVERAEAARAADPRFLTDLRAVLRRYEGGRTAALAGRAPPIDRNAGRIFGNMTERGGLRAAFDGDARQPYERAAVSGRAVKTGFVGKGWGRDRRISGYRVHGTGGYGFDSTGGASTITVRLYGANRMPSTAADGTELHVDSFADAADATRAYRSGINTRRAYRYHWVSVTTTAGSNDKAAIAEVEFFE